MEETPSIRTNKKKIMPRDFNNDYKLTDEDFEEPIENLNTHNESNNSVETTQNNGNSFMENDEFENFEELTDFDYNDPLADDSTPDGDSADDVSVVAKEIENSFESDHDSTIATKDTNPENNSSVEELEVINGNIQSPSPNVETSNLNKRLNRMESKIDLLNENIIVIMNLLKKIGCPSKNIERDPNFVPPTPIKSVEHLLLFEKSLNNKEFLDQMVNFLQITLYVLRS